MTKNLENYEKERLRKEFREKFREKIEKGEVMEFT